jgi:hypothetical protein
MNEVLTNPPYDATTASPVSPAWLAETSSDFQPVALMLEMESSAALLDVLTTIARLGCRITHVYATERQAALGVLAPRRLAHRLLPCLGQLIDVLAVREAPAALSLSMTQPGPSA